MGLYGAAPYGQFAGDLAVRFGEWMPGVQADGLVQVLNGLGVPAQFDADQLPLVLGLGVLRINGNGPVEIRNRFFAPLLAGQGYPPIQVSRHLAGPEDDGLAEVPDRCLKFQLVQMGSAPA